MRKILLIVLLALLDFAVKGQTPDDYHFQVKDGKIIWQQVYESPVDSTAFLDYIYGSGNFSDIAEISNGISVAIPPRSVDFRAAGLKAGSVSMYIINYTFTAHGLLEMREGRYRVTVDLIVFQSHPDLPLEAYALNRQGAFKPVFMSMNAAQALDSELTRLFTIKTAEKEDW